MSEIEHFISADEAAQYLAIRREFLLKLARAGEIPAHPLTSGRQRLRRIWRFRISELNSYMEKRMVKPS